MPENTENTPEPDKSDKSDEPLKPDKRPLDDLSLQAELRAYQEAIRQEWDIENNPELLDDPDKLAERARRSLIKATPNAIGTIVSIADHGQKDDNVRLSAAKFIVERALGKSGSATEEDAWSRILGEITKQNT